MILHTEHLLHEAESLPLEERASLADSLLKTLNPPDANIDKEWIALARKRLEEIRSGEIKPVSATEVFDGVRKILEK